MPRAESAPWRRPPPPTGKSLTLPGESFRVTRAHTSHGHTVLEVTGPTSARSYSSDLAERYSPDAAGKQITRATPAELQHNFQHDARAR